MIVGSLSLIDTADVALHLGRYTNQVFQNDRFFALMNGSGDEVIKLGLGTGGASAASDAAFVHSANLLNSELPELGNAFLLPAQPATNSLSGANSAASAVKAKALASTDALSASQGASRGAPDLGAGVVEETPETKRDESQPFPNQASTASGEAVAWLDEDSTSGNETRLEDDTTDF
jgi:hypothetical protein